MGILDKTTYGEHYWAMQVEAQNAFYEGVEQDLASYFRPLLSDILGIEEIPASVRNLLHGLAEPEFQAMGAVGLRFASEIADSFVGSAMHPYTRFGVQFAEITAKSNIMSPTQATNLYRHKKITQELWYHYMALGGYPVNHAKWVYQSFADYPTLSDYVLYCRYTGEPDNVWSALLEHYDIDPTDYKIWNWLGLQRLTTLQVQTLFRRGLVTEVELLNKLAQIGWSETDRILVEELGWTVPNAMLLVQGDLQQERSVEDILKDISFADINPKYAQQYLDAILTKPASQDLIAYELRQDPDLSDLNRKLNKIGIHPDYHELYKELAYQIPPVADIITMAVREAFTPEIATKFGQYEDYPPDLEFWAAKKGLSKEWSERYWASHWSLPSPLQGFEMLHRGAINQDELNMLLRALDIMPFWRDKLTRIAYRRLSRVDIRRMYRVGVMTEAEVYEAYLELGYNERDARRMSDFTVKQTLATQSKFTARDVITAYSKYMINRSEARSLLIKVGVKRENIDYIITTAEYKRSWGLTEERIAAIRNLYKRQVYDSDKARGELLKLDMPAERVDVIMEQWYIEEKDKPPRNWTTAQTLSFIKDGLITKERGIQELRNLDYNTEHINVYIESLV